MDNLPCQMSVSISGIFFIDAIVMSPTKGEGGHISFSVDHRRRRRRDSLYPPYFLYQWVEFYQTCMDTSLGQAKELIKF